MISRDELKRVFRLLRKHEDLLVSAHLDNGGVIDDTNVDIDTIEALVKTRLLWQPASDESARLTTELAGLFDRVLRDPRRLTLDADIGSFVIQIETKVNQYREAARSGLPESKNHYLNQIKRLVDELRSNLLDRSGQLWEKINSEFGYVSSLDLKIKENGAVLDQARGLNDSLEIIKVREIDDLAGHDYQLRRYLNRWLLDAVELCRKETVDAIHKLNNLLFEYRKQKRLGQLVDSFYRRYQNKPGYRPLDYTDMVEIPEVLNQVEPMALTGYANLDDPRHEVVLTEIISGLRKERVPIETPEPALVVDVQPEAPPIEKSLALLSQSVENFYAKVIDTDEPLSAVESAPSDEIEPDKEIWLYAVIARFNNMSQGELALFNLDYVQTKDLVFNGRYIISDVKVAYAGK